MLCDFVICLCLLYNKIWSENELGYWLLKKHFLSLRDNSKVFHVRLHYEFKRYSYTVLEAQNFPKLENLDIESQISEFKWAIHNALRRTSLIYRSDKQQVNISQHRWNGYQWRFLTNIEFKKEEYESLLEHLSSTFILYWNIYENLNWHGWRNAKLMDIVILVNIFICYGSILSMFPQKEKSKNCFLAACKICEENINLVEINQKFPYGGLIGYGNSFSDFFFARLKVFRLHAILQHSAGAVKASTNKGTGYCYILPNFPSSCFLGHKTGLIFCFFIKFCHPQIFKMLDC